MTGVVTELLVHQQVTKKNVRNVSWACLVGFTQRSPRWGLDHTSVAWWVLPQVRTRRCQMRLKFLWTACRFQYTFASSHNKTKFPVRGKGAPQTFHTAFSATISVLTDVTLTVDPPFDNFAETEFDPLFKLLPPTRVVVVVSLTVDSRFLYWLAGWLYRLQGVGSVGGKNYGSAGQRNKDHRRTRDMKIEFVQVQKLCVRILYDLKYQGYVIKMKNTWIRDV